MHQIVDRPVGSFDVRPGRGQSEGWNQLESVGVSWSSEYEMLRVFWVGSLKGNKGDQRCVFSPFFEGVY